MNRPSRRLTPFVALTSAALVLAACGGDTDASGESSSESSTSTSESASASSAPSESSESAASPSEENESVDAPEQQELTDKQILAALPTEDEAPEDFVADDNVDAWTESTRVVDPDECRTLYLDTDEIRAWKKKHRTGSGAARYTAPGDAAGRASVAVHVSSYDQPVPREWFDDAGAVMDKCKTFSEKNSPSSTSIDKKASVISAPTLGDQSYANRVGLTDLDLTIDQLYVRSGHNIINVRVLTGYSSYSDETLGELAEGVLDDIGG